MEKLTVLQQITQLHEEHVWLVQQLETLHVQMQKLVDAPASAEYKLSVSLAPKQENEPVVDEEGSVRTMSVTEFIFYRGAGRTVNKRKTDKLKVAVNVRLAVRVMGVLVEEYTRRKLVVEKHINKLIK